MNETTFYAICGAALVLLLMLIRWRWKKDLSKVEEQECPPCPAKHQPSQQLPPPQPVQFVHRLCPHHNVIQSYPVEQKDSLDEHLDVLTKKLAEKEEQESMESLPNQREQLSGNSYGKEIALTQRDSLADKLGKLASKHEEEGRLRLSKSKIRETQHEIENLQAIDHDVRLRYREIMENLKTDLLSNEKECKKLQDQIEWVSRRRAELREEVRRGQRMYGDAAAELASNLAELQRGRGTMVTDKPPAQYSDSSLRHRKEPLLPRATPVGSIVIKSPAPGSPDSRPRDHVTTERF